MTGTPSATAEGRHGPTAGARAILDIGPHAGALVVYADRELVGEEIEIRPHGASWQGTHTEVRERRVAGGVVHAGLFSSLAPGCYDVRLRPPSAGLHAHGATGSGARHTHGATDAVGNQTHGVTDAKRPPAAREITVAVTAGGVCEASLH